MIYLFCNDGYGRPFVEAAVLHARSHGLGLTLVYSTLTRGTPATGAVRWRRRAKEWLFARRMSWAMGVAVRLAPDVGSSSFVESIEMPADGIIAGFNQILPAGLIDAFRTLVNFHPSVLPAYRGPVPSLWCLKNGERHSGFTLHRVTERVDSGEVLHQERVGAEGITDPDLLDERIARAALPTLVRYLEHLRTGCEWPVVRLDASSVYVQQVRYAHYPDRT